MNHHLEEFLRAYASSDAYAFHMPGHKRVHRNLSAEGTDLYSYDITEIDGFDNLHNPKEILAEEMAFAARLYGVRETYFLVGGSTLGILTAISSAVPLGGRILIERGCHISVYHAAHLRQLRVSYIEDPWNPPSSPAQNSHKAFNKQEVMVNFSEEGSFPKAFEETDEDARGMSISCVSEHDFRKKYTTFDAIVLTSPTYEGAVRPVSKWAAFARQMNAILIIDEAHGAHLPFHAYFPPSATANGADLVVQSLHKTLPALTQTALLHNVSGRVEGRKIQAFLDIYETSSPSYLLLASITATLHGMADAQEKPGEGKDEFRRGHRGSEGGREKPGGEKDSFNTNTRQTADGQREERDEDVRNSLGESPEDAASSVNIMEIYVGRLRKLRTRIGRLRNFGLLGGIEEIARNRALSGTQLDTFIDSGKNTIPGGGETFVAEEFPGIPAGTPIDPGKIVILCRGSLDGPALYRRLRETYQLQPEMCGPDYVLCMTSVADTEEGFERLAVAMEELDRELSAIPKERGAEDQTASSKQNLTKENGLFGRELPPVACPIYEAAEAEAEYLPIQEAAKRISTGYILLYPPDAPLIVPGEVFTEEKIREILAWREKGFTIIGVDTQDCVAVKVTDCG